MSRRRLVTISVTISVTIRDGSNRSVTGSVTFSLANVAPSLNNLNATSSGLTATLTGNISDPSPSDSFKLQINWGDGTAVQTLTRPAGSTSFMATHDYQNDGTYSVTLTVSDDDNDSSTATTMGNDQQCATSDPIH